MGSSQIDIFHITTLTGIILDIRKLSSGSFEYLVEIEGHRQWYMTADIERKK
ncbi:MAG: hypothetical protein Q4C49_14205 [Bacillota bacterium]|nr:hypothetical protein [Bacillota bacterium]